MHWSVLCLFLCIAHVYGQASRLTRVRHNSLVGTADSLNSEILGYELFEAPTGGFANPSNQWASALPPVDQLPASARTLYFHWDPRPQFGNIGTVHPTFPGAQTLQFDFTGAPGANRRIKLEAPVLEVDPFACGGTAGATGSCRCNRNDNGLNPTYEPEAQVIVPGTAAGNTMTYTMPTATYFEHAPIPGQNPYLRTFRRICLESGVAGEWLDTNLYFAVVHSCVDNLANADQIDPTNRYRCSSASQLTDNAVANTLSIRVVPNGGNGGPTDTAVFGPNADKGYLGEFVDSQFPAVTNTLTARAQNQQITDPLNQVIEIFGESEAMRDSRLFERTQCCGALAAGVVAGQNVNQLGICIDPTISGCCGRRPFDLFNEKCCSRRDSRIGRLDLPCPCRTDVTFVVNGVTESRDCNNEGPNEINTDDSIGFGQGVTSDRTCCAITKYPTYADVARFGNTIFPQAGFCVLDTPNAANPWRCCDDGNVYDPASAQCCPINGVQSINIPCPCASDNQCPQEGGGQRCCVQFFPPVFPPQVGPDHCSAFSNYPMPGAQANAEPQIAAENFLPNNQILYHSPRGFPYRGPVPYTSAYVQSFCPGQCYRTQWQICCNGNICIDQYERCCNDTCCNTFTSKCAEGQRPGALANRVNALNYNVWFEVCTAKENLTARRAFFVFALPIMLLFATLAGLAIVTVLARRATEHTFDLTEKILVFVAAISVLIAAAFFFSPLWKYGLFIAFIDIVAIMISVIRKRRYSLLLVILLIIKLLLLLDPFGGNIFLSLTGGVPQFSEGPEQEPINMVGRTDLSSSLYEAVQRLWDDKEDCVRFYDYFMFDNNVRDYIRRENPDKMTFGYCSRGWITTLLVLAALLYLLQFLLLLLAIFSLAKKFGRKPSEVIQLEVVQENAPMVIG